MAGAERIYIAAGKKILAFVPEPASREEIMKNMLGRSGTLRAPTLRRGKTFYIGFNDELYHRLLADTEKS